MNQIKTVLLALARKWKYRKFKHVASSAWIANNESIVSCIHNHTTENWTKNIQNDKKADIKPKTNWHKKCTSCI